MAKKARPNRTLADQLLSAAKTNDFAEARLKVASWVEALFTSEAGLLREPISELDLLRLWGYESGSSFVHIASKFNTATKRKKTIRPPDLILGVSGKTVGDLVDFLTRRLLQQPFALLDQRGPVIDPNFVAKDIVADLAVADDSLRGEIQKFTLDFLRPGYLAVNTGIHLGVFRDGGATLSGLYEAFQDAVQGGDLSGSIDAGLLNLPRDEYLSISKNKKSTVATLIEYFRRHAEQARRR